MAFYLLLLRIKPTAIVSPNGCSLSFLHPPNLHILHFYSILSHKMLIIRFNSPSCVILNGHHKSPSIYVVREKEKKNPTILQFINLNSAFYRISILQCVMLTIRTLHVLIRYGMFLYDMRQGAISTEGKPKKQFFRVLQVSHRIGTYMFSAAP